MPPDPPVREGTAAAAPRPLPHPVQAQARLVGLLRVLLLVVALGVVAIFLGGSKVADLGSGRSILLRILIGVAITAGVLFALVPLVRWRWQLAVGLVFDLLWIGGVLYCTGGVASPGVAMLFAVVLIGNLVLPGVAPFVLSALSALVLAVLASLYLGGNAPLPATTLASLPELTAVDRILGTLAVQVVALFLVDALAQILARRLREAQLFTREVLDRLGEGVLAADRHGRIVYANAEALDLLDLHRRSPLPAADLPGRAVTAVLTGSDLAPALDLLTARALPAMRRMDGAGGRHLLLRAHPLARADGQAIGSVLLIADETRVRIAEDNARRAEHLASLGEMAAGIAHEVRNPLTSLRGCAQELGELCERLGDRDATSLAEILVSESDRLARIVSDFLALSRMRAPERIAVAMHPVLDELAQLCRNRRDLPAGITLTFAADADCPQAFADPGQLRQVLANLVNNGIDAVLAAPQPQLTCRASSTPLGSALGEGHVRITVSDNGCGIPEILREAVFTPFFSTKAKGTGLGLSLVGRIVRAHSGLIELTSQPGQGTTMTVDLPAADLPVPNPTPPALPVVRNPG